MTTPPARSRRQGGSRLLRVALIGLACLGAIVATLFYVGYGPNLMAILGRLGAMVYHPLAVALVVALGVQYVMLKSGDRSRLLQIELDKLRGKRRTEVTMLRETRESLERLKALAAEDTPDMDALKAECDRAFESLRPAEARLLRKTEED